MAVLKPFNAVRPDAIYADKVAELPYDVMSSDEAREIAKDNPYSFLHVDKAEIDLPKDIDLYDKKVYEKARDNLYGMINDKIFIKEEKPMFYVYELIMNGRSQTGIVGLTSVFEYDNGIIKKHELTRADKEQDRINHIDYCNANTGPIFIAYKKRERIKEIIDNIKKNVPLYDFTKDTKVTHKVWQISEDKDINELISEFEKVPNLYIADGHHRNASAAKVAKMRRDAKENATGEEEFNFCLSVLFAEDELKILDYNRVIKDLNGFSEEEFIEKIKEKFEVSLCGKEAYKPEKRHTFGMFLNEKWYKLEAKDEYIGKDIVSSLDVAILQKEVLEPILNIGDVRKDKRIDFVGGIRGLLELEKLCKSGEMKIAFSMYPTSIEELMEIADNNLLMPPKSTWFEPKLLSGLFVHTFD